MTELPDLATLVGLAAWVGVVTQFFKAKIAEDYVPLFALLVGVGTAMLYTSLTTSTADPPALRLALFEAFVRGTMAAAAASGGWKYLPEGVRSTLGRAS